MKFLTLIVLLLVACAPSPQQNFDEYLEMLMAEPYDPINGSKY
jgi:hypothetical protein